jgi:hypothetical protein
MMIIAIVFLSIRCNGFDVVSCGLDKSKVKELRALYVFDPEERTNDLFVIAAWDCRL